MKIAFLFPGQGCQKIGMGKELYDKYEEVRKIYDRVSKITGIDIAQLTFFGDEAELNKTSNAQIAILTMSLGMLEILKIKNITADVSLGLSLGEYSALIYAGVLSFEDGIKIVQKRGEFMQNLVPEGEWQMAALLGTNREQAQKLCKEISKGFVVPVNFNCPGQIVISGDREGIDEAIAISKNFNIKRITKLKTSGPFHTIKLKEASEALKKELEKIKINEVKSCVIKNIDATKYSKEDDVKGILAKHIISPVEFSSSIENMINMGIDTVVEVGPGNTLTSFVKKIKPDINILKIE